MANVKEFTETIFYGVSTVAVLAAGIRYIWTRDQQSGETLLKLEEHFAKLGKPWTQGDVSSDIAILRAIDPETGLFSKTPLGTALAKSGGARSTIEEAWMARLDELVRLLLLVAAMEQSRLLRRRALWDLYSYWFNAIYCQELLCRYVRENYPHFYKFMSKRIHSEIYWRLTPVPDDAASKATERVRASSGRSGQSP